MLLEKLDELGACSEALKWVKEMNGDNPEKLWNECERGDWMLWLIAQLNIDRKRIVLAACQCARLTLHLVPKGENRPKIAIETAEAWVRGEATLEELDEAAWAASAAAWAARAAARAAAWAASAAAWAASAAASAASAAAWAASAASAATLKECADITRQIFTYNEVAEILFKEG